MGDPFTNRERPADGILEQAGYDFANDLQKGNTMYGDLDAALIGAGVEASMVSGSKNRTKTAVSFASALLNHDVAGALGMLPDYDALNAWDMADSLQQ